MNAPAMIPTTRGLLRILLIASICAVDVKKDTSSSATHARARPQERAAPGQPAPALPLTEQRLQVYAECRERLDPLAIRAILEAHERIGNPDHVRGELTRLTLYRLEQISLPIYGDNLVEWLLDEDRTDLKGELIDPLMEAAFGRARTDSALTQLGAQAARCGLGSAAAYWETTGRIAVVLDDRRWRRPKSVSSNEREEALLDRFLGRLGLCTGSGKFRQTAQGPLVCWSGLAIVGAPCPSDMNRGSTGYSERDGVCYSPVGRPAGPRLRRGCSRAGEVRRDVPAYPVLCESGVWVHVLPCSKDADCHPESYALPRSCKRGLCYARHPDRERPITRR